MTLVIIRVTELAVVITRQFCVAERLFRRESQNAMGTARLEYTRRTAVNKQNDRERVKEKRLGVIH